MANASLDTILKTFSQTTENPASFLSIGQDLSENLKSNIKNVYDFTKYEEKGKSKPKGKSLDKLIVDNFDLEQIWQQIELQNDDVMDRAVKDLSSLLVNKNQLVFKSLNLEEHEDLEEEEEAHNIDLEKDNDELLEFSEDEGESSSSDMDNKQTTTNKNLKSKGSVVDDDFFKLSEMEEFLRREENPKEPKNLGSESESDEEGSVDFFEEGSEASSGDEAKTAKFKDYFVAKEDEENVPKRKTNKLMEELDQEEDDDDSDPELMNNLKSTLELRQERLQKKIKDLEEQAITEKSWQLKGEITAESRPQNSLLQEIVEFDLTTRPAPIITEQTSLQLEDIIRQRIKHKTFDSVEKISKPIETPLEYRKKLVLDQEKSKESLAKIYEKEFLEQQTALNKDNADAPEKEPESHKDLKKLMKTLFSKLDALSNFHFTSTPAIPELKIVSNLPAVNMEEVAPVATSDAALLAPEEVRNKSRGDIVGKGEKTGTDKKRERRKKKLKQKIHAKRKAKIEEVVSKKKDRVKA